MNKVVLTIMLSIYSNVGYSQTVVLEILKLRYAYIGLRNSLTVVVPNVDCSRITVFTDNGEIKGEGCNYIYFPYCTGVAQVTVAVKRGKRTRIVDKQMLKVKNLPEAVVTLAGKSGGYISRAILLAEIGPFARLPDFDYDFKLRLTKCTVFICAGADTAVMHQQSFEDTNGISFDANMYKVFGKLTHNDLVVLKGISFVGDDGIEKGFPDLTYLISH